MPRGPARPFPSVPLREALRIAQGIREHNAGHPMNRILLAEALGQSPSSSGFRDLVTAANKFGLVKGNYNSESLSLTPLGEMVTRPESEEERLNALRQAMEHIPLFKRLLEHFNNNKLPAESVLKGILEGPPFGVSSEWSTEAGHVFSATGRFTGVIREVGGAPYVILDAGPPLPEADQGEATGEEERANEEALGNELEGAVPVQGETPLRAGLESVRPAPTSTSTPVRESEPRQFFIAHGRDKEALAQLQSILKELDIPYLVAEDEANAGRPISQKVADLMRACSAGIFIFSGDETVTTPDGASVKRPRPNVVYELGAASFQYGQRIVIFKEQGVEFPTDFRDLGYIEYDKGQLSAKSMELLRELIKLKAVRITPGSSADSP